MNIKNEAIITIYQKDRLVALIKRDDASRKNIVYTVKEASAEQIAGLIGNESEMV